MPRIDIEKKLDMLDFTYGDIKEAIVTSINDNNTPNSAPMGVTRTGKNKFEIKPFKTSTTYTNLIKRHRACINITGDPSIFLISAFKGELAQSHTLPQIDENLRLISSDAHIFVNIVDQRILSMDRTCFTCEVISIEINKKYPSVFSRGKAETIEAIIHVTRIQHLIDQKDWAHVKSLIKQFFMCKEIVRRVSSSSSNEMLVIKELENLITNWREQLSRLK
jgi:hypothetical protein